MKTTLLVIIGLVLAQVTFSQNSAYPDQPYVNLFDFVVEGDNILGAGSCGNGMFSADGGVTWDYFPLDVEYSVMEAVPGENAKKAFIMADFEILIIDYTTKELTTSGISSVDLVSGEFKDMDVVGNLMYITAGIGIFEVNLDDMSHRKISEYILPSGDIMEHSDVTESYVYSLTRKGVLFKSTIATGEIETVQELGENTRTLAMASDLVGYIGLSSSNNPIKTIDGGETWTALTAFSESSRVFSDGEDVVMSINTNRILVSTDGGQTVEYVPYNDDYRLSFLGRIRFLGSGHAIIMGTSSMVVKTDNYGLDYEVLTPQDRTSFNAVDIHSDGTGIAVSSLNTIITTTDNGDTWTNIVNGTDLTAKSYSTVVALGGGEFIAGYEDGLHKIVNGEVSMLSEEGSSRLLFSNDGQYLMNEKQQGSDFLIRKSTDGGETWETKYVVSGYGALLSQNTEGTLYKGGGDSNYFVSTDAGETWEVKTHDLADGVNEMAFYNDNLGLMIAGRALMKTEDGGETFTELRRAYAQRGVTMISEDHYVLTGAQNSLTTVFQSKDGGETWSIIDGYCKQSFSHDFEGDRFWMGQRFGHLNYTQIDLSTAVEEIEQSPLMINGNILQRGSSLNLEIEGMDEGTGFLLNSSGVMSMEFDVRNGNVNLSTESLNAGLYFVKITSSNRIYSGKIVVVN